MSYNSDLYKKIAFGILMLAQIGMSELKRSNTKDKKELAELLDEIITASEKLGSDKRVIATHM